MERVELFQAHKWALKKIEQDPLWWARNCTRTFDQHWLFNGLTGPYNPFPAHRYLDLVFDYFEVSPRLVPTHNRKVRILPKSRKLMVSWAAVAKCVHFAQTVPEQEIVLQSQAQKKGNYLIRYAKVLYAQQPQWLRDQFPLKRGYRIEDFPMDELEWGNGSKMIGIPEGADAVRSYHPSILVMDEAAFQPEGEDAYDAGLAGAQFVMVVSSAGAGWFQELTGEDRLPRHAPQLTPGVYFTENRKGQPVLWVHYSAHPDRGPSWVAEDKPNYKSEARWNREQEIDFTATGGERVLRDKLEERWRDIVIQDDNWRPHSAWIYGAGLDYGKRHQTAFEVFGRELDGTIVAVMEHYRSGMTPQAHAKVIRDLTLPLPGTPTVLSRITATFSDPSLFPESHPSENSEKFTSIQQLFEQDGSLKMAKGIRGLDQYTVDLILDMWEKPKPGFRIWCPNPIPRKTEGTFAHGCPNLLWELGNLRRKEISPVVEQNRGQPEGLVDKDNDAWDATKEFLTSNPETPEEDPEVRYERHVEQLRQHRPNMSFNQLIHVRQEWEARQQAAEEPVSYR